jgi:hypothetical protein
MNRAIVNMIVREEKYREEMIDALKRGTPEGIEWAKNRGLTHWHEIGFGCSPTCLEGVGKVISSNDLPKQIVFKRKPFGPIPKSRPRSKSQVKRIEVQKRGKR